MTVFENLTASPITPLHQRSFGTARLSVKSVQDKTRISDLYQEGCAKLRMPQTEANGLQAVMINSSGGMTGGDRLDWAFHLGESTRLTVTTQACERVYAAKDEMAHANIEIEVSNDAKLAWLPQETILFDNCSLYRKFEINLANNSELLMVEPVIFGRTAMNEAVMNGFFKDRWRITKEDRLLHAEDTLFQDNVDQSLQSLAQMNGNVAMATILLVAPRAEFLREKIRDTLAGAGGVSFWNGKLLARVIAKDGYSLRKTLVPLMKLMNEDTQLPKVWAL